MTTPLELLAPAKNLEQGILALRCGADALYMGPDRFGARQGAACHLHTFEQLTSEARLWGAKVYATLNTLLFDHELEAARQLAWQLYETGVDALIIQDMALLQLDLPPLPLHASTQAVCDSPEKVAFLASVGISRAILARELSLTEIAAIRDAADIELEAFVYGALCVGESGKCYLSGAICGAERSGNRGACAQPCRSQWHLLDGAGRVLIKDQALLSIQDLDLSDQMGDMAKAGIRSFKIEGRLKDADYVKNVVSHFRQTLDQLIDSDPTYGRASLGRVHHGFVPDPTKTFQRGLSAYRIDGLRRPMASTAAGHLGEAIGVVRSVQADRITLTRTDNQAHIALHPGDGLVFVEGSTTRGTLVNGVQNNGCQLLVQEASRLRPGTLLYRNLDHDWLKALRGASVERRLTVEAWLHCETDRISLQFVDETGLSGKAEIAGSFAVPHDPPQTAHTLQQALARLGDTPFVLGVCHWDNLRFVPVSAVNALRRQAAADLEQHRRALRRHPVPRQSRRSPLATPLPLPRADLDFTWNIANQAARHFYETHGAKSMEAAAECQPHLRSKVVMTTRHCLRFDMGWCDRHPNPTPRCTLPPPPMPLVLVNGNTRLQCLFDCEACRMRLVWL